MTLEPFSEQNLMDLYRQAEWAAQGEAWAGKDWVALLEFVPGPGAALFDLSDVASLVETLREWHPSALYCPERYAIQISVTATEPDEALRLALARHAEAGPAGGDEVPRCVRSEILTQAEFENDLEGHLPGGRYLMIDPTFSVTKGPDFEAATQALVAAQSPSEVKAILARFVASIGEDVHFGPSQSEVGNSA